MLDCFILPFFKEVCLLHQGAPSLFLHSMKIDIIFIALFFFPFLFHVTSESVYWLCEIMSLSLLSKPN